MACGFDGSDGTVEDPDLGLWQTVIELLRNAFVRSLLEGIEGSVDLDSALATDAAAAAEGE